MSVWKEISQIVTRGAAQALGAVLEAVRTVFSGDAATRAKVSFSIAIIALSAKMAKADGVVTDDEVRAFQEVFIVPPEEFENVAWVYNLAKQDVAGFETYVSQVAHLFSDEPAVLSEVLAALFHVAVADGILHENELDMLRYAADIFEISESDFERIRLMHVVDEEADPYLILGVERNWEMSRIRARYHELVRENHPDRLLAKGVPEEFMKLAHDRMASINDAWSRLSA